eukprot:CAMPEP_0117501424 /NCGR_PEP_ID=MMETSP0784-20121206/23290_1 /TAXON_ID=39447 /ORGANISM="" /LENGTH=576 /DNA_ID=CAMNT_0005296675 /DNA_START=48 /DNA_END=1775 /DNA_ORIENTATION=+
MEHGSDGGIPFSKAGAPPGLGMPDGSNMMLMQAATPGFPQGGGMMGAGMMGSPGMPGAPSAMPAGGGMPGMFGGMPGGIPGGMPGGMPGMPGMAMPNTMAAQTGGMTPGVAGQESAAGSPGTMSMVAVPNPMFGPAMGGNAQQPGFPEGAATMPGQSNPTGAMTPAGGMMMPAMMQGMMPGMMSNPMMAAMMAGQGGAAGEPGKDAAGGQPPGVPPGMVMVPNPMFLQLAQQNPMMAQMMMQMQQQMAQNPMMAQQMMQNMAMNPMMSQMMANNPMFANMARPPQAAGKDASGGGCGCGVAAPAAAAQQAEKDDAIDADVQELGDYFNIEERWIRRLNETMKKRKDTKEQDIAKLYEVLERARSPTGLLTVKIGEMECGQFVGKIKPDKDVERLAKKFKLDEHVISRLTELAVRRKTTKEADLERMEQHLRYCKRPSAMATLLAGKLLEGEVDELPDLSEAEALMTKYKLDEDAKSKLREIIEKRHKDQTEVLACIKKHLDSSTYASSMLCKIARPLIDGEKLPDPPERKDRPERSSFNPAAADKGDEKRDRDRDRRDRSRDRDRRDKEKERDRDR